MGEALYRKYRPQKLADVIGQPHITTTLSNALSSGRISHGYLFAGPRGVGKTSVARILAHQLNDFTYGDPKGSLDIIEIDAASNRRIDEIRELRDKVHIAPAVGKYKIYIIDEVHMLTKEAFNALLKTLEEPPAHTVFILATTEIHKLPETIVSRTQRYTFKEVSRQDVIEHLHTLSDKEGITIDDDALELLAEHGEGSFRDSIGLLDQMAGHKHVKKTDVEKMLGIPSRQIVTRLLEAIRKGDVKEATSCLDEQRIAGINATILSKQILQEIRYNMIHETTPHDLIDLSKNLLQVPGSNDPYQLLEIYLIEYALMHRNDSELTSGHSNGHKAKQLVASANTASISVSKPTKLKPAIASKPISSQAWTEIVQDIKKTNNTLYGVARMAQPSIVDKKLTLLVPFAFHKKRLSDERNSRIISELLQAKGYSHGYEVIVQERDAKTTNEKKPKPNASSDTLESVKAIFGGGEILE